MKESEPISDYFDRVQVIINQMRISGEEITDQRVVERIIRILSHKFDTIVDSIIEGQGISNLSIERLFGSLSSHEQRWKHQNNNSNNSNNA